MGLTPDVLVFGLMAVSGALLLWAADADEVVLSTYHPARAAGLVPGQRVALTGTLHTHAVLRAPLSRRPCVYWRVEAHHTEDGDERTSATEQWSDGLTLHDESGSVPLDPTAGLWRAGTAREAPLAMAQKRRVTSAIAPELLAGASRLVEYTVPPGAEVRVAGVMDLVGSKLALGGGREFVVLRSSAAAREAAKNQRLLGGALVVVGIALSVVRWL